MLEYTMYYDKLRQDAHSNCGIESEGITYHTSYVPAHLSAFCCPQTNP